MLLMDLNKAFLKYFMATVIFIHLVIVQLMSSNDDLMVDNKERGKIKEIRYKASSA